MSSINPKVSVLLPVYQGEKYLPEAIESILNQTVTDFEFIIIDDASTDRSAEIIRSYIDQRIRFLRNDSNLGLIGTLNRGLQEARGEYIARMDQDDISLPSRLEKQVAFMDSRAELAASGTWARDIDANGEPCGLRHVPFGKRMKYDFWRPSPLIHPTSIIRVAHLGAFRYDQQARYVEDFDLWLRLRKTHQLDNLPEYLLLYRVHDESMSRRNLADQLHAAYESLCRQAGLRLSYEVFREVVGASALRHPLRHAMVKRRLARMLGNPYRPYLMEDLEYARRWLNFDPKFESFKSQLVYTLYRAWRRIKTRTAGDPNLKDRSRLR